MFTGYVLECHRDRGILLIPIPGPPGDFLDDHHLLLLRVLNGERRSSLGRIDFVTTRHGRLDVLRRVLRSPNDDRILHAAGDEKLAILEEAEDRKSVV